MFARLKITVFIRLGQAFEYAAHSAPVFDATGVSLRSIYLKVLREYRYSNPQVLIIVTKH